MNNKVSDPLIANVLEHFDEIFERTSELYDCALMDQILSIQLLCDDRIPQPAVESCQQLDLQCYIDAMQQSTDGSGICSTLEEMKADSTDSSNTSMCACDA